VLREVEALRTQGSPLIGSTGTNEYAHLMQVIDRAMGRIGACGAAAPGDLGARLPSRRRANGIDRSEEHRNETSHSETDASGEEIRSGAGGSLQ